MNKHFLFIALFLLCLLVSRPAEARLTLGVVIGTDEAAGEISSDQARSLASLLAEKLEDDVAIKELADSATLINWLDRFAMLDLAILSAQEVKSNPGKFLLIGPYDEQGKLSLVSRQGVGGVLPQRAAQIVRESGFAYGKSVETIMPPVKPTPEEPPLSALSDPTSIEEVLVPRTELQQVPPLSPGRAWIPQGENVYRDVLPSDAPLAKKLVLGVLPDPKGLIRTLPQAQLLAAYLEKSLPVSVKVREFSSLEAFSEWFMRYRMIDLAVLSPAAADANLGRDYLPVAKLFRSDKPGVDSAELVVMRRGKSEEIQAPLQRVLIDMAQTADGQSLLAALNINAVVASQGISSPVSDVDQAPEPAIAVEKPPVELAVETLEELLPPTPDNAEPVEPQAPAEVVVKVLPELPEIAVPTVIPPAPEERAVIPALVAPASMPVEPVQPTVGKTVIIPNAPASQSEPLPPEVPPTPVVAAPMPPTDLAAIADPPAIPVVPAVPVVEPALQILAVGTESSVEKQQKIIEELTNFSEGSPAHELAEVRPVVPDDESEAWSDAEVLALLGENTVAAVISQPDLPQELRPSGIPIVRPHRIQKRATASADELIVASMPEPLKKVEPVRPPDLLPEPEPEPGIVYVVPFVAVMVPDEVDARIFDQFVDALNREGETLGLQFVILKEGLQRVAPEWLAIRKYVTGEIYAYVEDTGSSWTELRTKARLTYRRPHQNAPAFGFEYPVKSFFDHDRSTIDVERLKLADDIAMTLADELLKALKN